MWNGWGTGTGSAPVVAEVAKRQKSLTVAVVTLPFTVEGRKRIENAMMGLERLSENSDTIIVIPNDKILKSLRIYQLMQLSKLLMKC